MRLLVILALLIVAVSAADITVHVATTGSDATGDGSETKPYLTLSKALAATASNDGDVTVQVATGEYAAAGNMNLEVGGGRVVHVVGALGEADVPPQFDLHFGGRFVQLSENSHLSLEKLLVERAVAPAGQNGGAVSAAGSSSLALTDVTFSLCSASAGGHGGALYADGESSVTASNCYFTASNVTGGGHGGFVALFEGQATFVDTTFAGGVVEDGQGGAVYVKNAQAAAPTFRRCYLLNNRVRPSNASASGPTQAYGGAVSVAGVPLSSPTGALFVNSSLHQNEATDMGGAVYVAALSVATFQGCSLSNNVGQLGGAVAAAQNAAVTLDVDASNGDEPTVLLANAAGADASGLGGGLYALAGLIKVDRAEFRLNSAAYGGGLYQSGGPGHLSPAGGNADSTNVTEALFSANTAARAGAGIYVELLNEPVWVLSCLFDGNIVAGLPLGESGEGGGALYGNQVRVISGGAAFPSAAGLASTVFEQNKAADDGGAVRLVSCYNSTFRGVSFVSNECGQSGGAVSVDTRSADAEPAGAPTDYVLFAECRFSLNKAGFDNPEHPQLNRGSGGAVAVSASAPIFYRSTFHDNSALLNGGAIHADSDAASYPHAIHTSFVGNAALNGSVAYLRGASHGLFFNSTYGVLSNAAAVDRDALHVDSNGTAIFLDAHFPIPHAAAAAAYEHAVAAMSLLPAAYDVAAASDSDDDDFDGCAMPSLYLGNAGVARVLCQQGAAFDFLTLAGQDALLSIDSRDPTESVTVVVRGHLDWQGGAVSCAEASTLSLAPSSASWLSGVTVKALDGCTLSNQGTLLVEHDAGPNAYDLLLLNGARIENLADLELGDYVRFGTPGGNQSTLHNKGSATLISGTFALESAINANTFDLQLDSKSKWTLALDTLNSTELAAQPSVIVDGTATLGGSLFVALPADYKSGSAVPLIDWHERSGKFKALSASVGSHNYHLSASYESNQMVAKATKSSSGGNSLTGGAIAGIVIGILAAVVLIVLAGIYYVRRRNAYETIN
jgi:predicted outer membrane repeat protein